jgi:hypothetical protein
VRRQGQAEAILVAYDIMEVDGQEDVRPEPLGLLDEVRGFVKAICLENRSSADDDHGPQALGPSAAFPQSSRPYA